MNKIFNTKTAKVGFSVMAVTALVLVILMLVNLLAGVLPKNITLLDLSENKMYSVSDAAKRDIAKVKEKVDIYLLTAGGESSLSETGIHLDTFLKRAAAQNGKLSYKVVDLYTDTEFLTEHGIDSSSVTALSVVVESERRHRYIDSTEFFYYYIEGIGKVNESEAQMYQYYASMYGTTLNILYQFAGESLMVNALSFVTSADVPTVIALTGHGETAISSSLQSEFTTLGVSYSELSTLYIVPGCELLIINAPTSDISENEAALLSEYLGKGGKLMVSTVSPSSAFTNLISVLEKYGLNYIEGVIIDPTSGSYYQYPNWLTPTAKAHTATGGVTGSVLLPSAHAIEISDTAGITASPIFNTSSASYVIAIDAASAEKPEDTEEASYPIGVIAEATNGSAITWISSGAFLDDTANQYSSGGNYAYASAITSYLCGVDTSSAAVNALTLTSETLSINNGALAIIALLIVAVVPLSVIIIGTVYCYRRKMR